ncbi:ImmA/IrrE family metallo-endopeptidase [Vibrio fluvialis]
MTKFKLDSIIVNGTACSNTNSNSIFESYVESRKKLDKLPKAYKKDEQSVLLSLFKESHYQKTNNAFFRKHDSANDALISYWISKVKNLAHLYISMNDIPEFSGITKQEIMDIARNTSDVSYIKNIESTLASKGIILVIEPSISGLKTDGAIFKATSGHPVIAMSLRYKRLDNFWFTLMHELAHLHLHYDDLDGYIVDDFDVKSTDIIELEANKLAGDALIPRHLWRTCHARKDLKPESVESFATKNNVHPAIVAGRIRREKDDFSLFSKIVNKVKVQEVLFDE